MTGQAKEICEILVAAGLRGRGFGAKTVTYPNGTTRVDWDGPDEERPEKYRQIAETLRGAGYHVQEHGACVTASQQAALL
jgi:hypothetical protein